jgi:hypothetical protein
MRYARVFVLAAFTAAAGALGQQPAAQPDAKPPAGPTEIYQIDLVPTGSGFALSKPVLEGDVYVFQVWPDRATVRLPKSKVKKIGSRTKDVDAQVAYQIDLAPSGQMFSRDEPVLKGTSYQFHRWRGGDLMSVRQSDVRKITRLAGLDALATYLRFFGAKQIGDLPMEGGTATIAGGASAADAANTTAGFAGQPTNWLYFGLPGVTDAWAPPPAVVESPGDVPRAPDPQPQP